MSNLITSPIPMAIQTTDRVECMQILQTIFSAIKSEHT
jgi:hypothetical protein